VSGWVLGSWAALSLGLYVAYHPLAARLWYPRARRLFDDPRFLLPCTGLGALLTVLYLLSGSLWIPVTIHWIVVLVWLRFLGGEGLLTTPSVAPSPPAAGTP
jgi:predicted Abi (CAAX) family protease